MPRPPFPAWSLQFHSLPRRVGAHSRVRMRRQPGAVRACTDFDSYPLIRSGSELIDCFSILFLIDLLPVPCPWRPRMILWYTFQGNAGLLCITLPAPVGKYLYQIGSRFIRRDCECLVTGIDCLLILPRDPINICESSRKRSIART